MASLFSDNDDANSEEGGTEMKNVDENKTEQLNAAANPDGEHAVGENKPEKEFINIAALHKRIRALKLQKSTSKTAFTKCKNKLEQMLETGELSRKGVRNGMDALNDLHVEAMDIMAKLAKAYEHMRDYDNVAKIDQEIETLEAAVSEDVETAREYLTETGTSRSQSLGSMSVKSNVKSEISNKDFVPPDQNNETVDKTPKGNETVDKTPKGNETVDKTPKGNETVDKTPKGNETVVNKSKLSKSDQTKSNDTKKHAQDIGQEMWKQIRRISIPVFSGDVKTYQSWKSAFMTCIDQSPATQVYKLLQLRQSLSGEALKVIESLGHSATAYDVALDRLERKFGGHRRQMAIQMETLTRLKPIREGNAKDIERFADALDLAVVNLTDTDKVEELGNGLFYTSLLQKMPETMVANFERWLYENERQGSVKSLREWVMREAEYRTVASEAVHGVVQNKHDHDKKRSSFAFVSAETNTVTSNVCILCNGSHGIWQCESFKASSVPERWGSAKSSGICFRCLRPNHSAKTCKRMKQCGINGCKKFHNRMLHMGTTDVRPHASVSTRSPSTSDNVVRKEVSTAKPPAQGTVVYDRSHTTLPYTPRTCVTALRTVPVVLKNGNKQITVNALLDDASTRSYMNADVAAELGLEGKLQKVSVKVLNNQIETFETQPVECTLESVDAKVSTRLCAMTTQQVTGNMPVIDWQKHKGEWNHLSNVDFPISSSRPYVDLLIGIDHLHLHIAIAEVRGKPGEPFARKTPLGWTCIGKTSCGENRPVDCDTFFSGGPDVDVNNLLTKFCELEDIQRDCQKLTIDEHAPLDKAQKTLALENDKYKVAIPWKEASPLTSCLNVSDASKDSYGAEKKTLPVDAVVTDEVQTQWRLDPCLFSCWKRYTRIYDWVLRFLLNCKLSLEKRVDGELSVEVMEDANEKILMDTQREAFADDCKILTKGQNLKSKLTSLHPVIDNEGLMQLDGRFKYAECMSEKTRFSVILPRHHWVIKMKVKQHHEEGYPVAGTNQTLASHSSRYWIIDGREAVRKWEHQCSQSRRNKSRPASEIMALLPAFRLKSSLRGFTQTGVDVSGPFLTVQRRAKMRQKRYLCLFTCRSTKAVAYGLDTDPLLDAFYRMANRRGLPELMLSDNGTNFVKLKPVLKEGDVVLVISPNIPRGQLQFGRIRATHPGADGHTRVVDVQVGQVVLTRPITKVCPLELTPDDEHDVKDVNGTTGWCGMCWDFMDM